MRGQKAVQSFPNDESIAESWRFFREDLGNPRFVAAPMVGKSDLPFRLLLKGYGFDLCWTPMFHSEDFACASETDRFRQGFDTCREDEPLIVQFAANNAADFLEAALAVQDSCVAVDLNLGCPQSKAMKGGWGGALMDEENWHVVRDIVKQAVTSPLLRVPVTCKIRIFQDEHKTVRFAKMLEEAGCSVLTVHGRQRCRELHHAPANWSAIRAVKEALRIPVIANGGVSSRFRAEECLAKTGCAAVMIATAALSNPEMLVLPCSMKSNTHENDGCDEESTACSQTSESMDGGKLLRSQSSVLDQCLRYLDLCESHPPWSLRGPKEHLRTWLSPLCKDFESLERIGEDAGPSPAPFTDAHHAYWQKVCKELREFVEAECVHPPVLSTSRSPSVCHANSGVAKCKKMEAIGRTVQVSSRFVREQRRRAAALQSCMVAVASTK
eukprot:gnl/MRDRNA2_/MRDRNA2_100343_c0_seq1.p1 gnl/MRDRNA2_/MRDRNA2_100343_c0~~gnl/MRDRNA2_/MRDRNA2_100343_c0_seq1.p1  ORF type:complete len:440 (-),score=80.16 gnl/MRDRNA2_/MRDRNA2_100343_c0_seq1:154-1473(-)